MEADAATLAALQLPAGAKVYHFTRLRKVGGKPLALMENWVRDDIAAMDEALLALTGPLRDPAPRRRELPPGLRSGSAP